MYKTFAVSKRLVGKIAIGECVFMIRGASKSSVKANESATSLSLSVREDPALVRDSLKESQKYLTVN